VAAALCGTVCIAAAQDTEPRGVAGVTTPDGSALVGKNYLLVIGINTYARFPSLQSAVRDARAVREVCMGRYSFERAFELYDEAATRKGIMQLVRDVARKCGMNDSLFVYYAGHGHLDPVFGTGFWIPQDGERDAPETWVSNVLLKQAIANMAARHVLLVSDSCFSGDFFERSTAVAGAIDNAYYRRVFSKPSRQIMTSGGLEPVVDSELRGHSPFAHFFVQALRGNRRPWLTASGIFPHICEGFELRDRGGQIPLFGYMRGTGSQRGEFLFFLRPENVKEWPAPTAGSAALPQPVRREPRKGAGLPPGFEKAFMIPQADTDQQGNPVVTRRGSRFDAKTGWSYEIWLREPRMEFVLIPAGKNPKVEEAIEEPFFMGKYEVTQAQYEALIGSNPSKFKGASRPVESVSWTDAGSFCAKLTAHTGATVMRPSEAWWEYACLAGATTEYCFGSSDTMLPLYAWYGCETTFPVGRKRSNAWGMYDMHGNVWEWNGQSGVCRGGSWANGSSLCRASSRFAVDGGSNYHGFRVCMFAGTPN